MSSPYEQLFEIERRIESDRQTKVMAIDGATARLRELLHKYNEMLTELSAIADLLREVAVTDAAQAVFASSREPRKTRTWYVLTSLENGPLGFGDMFAAARTLGFESTGNAYLNFKDGVIALRKQGKVDFDRDTKLYSLVPAQKSSTRE